jgi:hypothetical protein
MRSQSDADQVAMEWVRYITRSVSVLLFFGSVVLGSVKVSLLGKDQMTRNHYIGSFATGAFIGIPLTWIEEVNLPDSQLWYNFLAAGWLFLVWYVSFSLLFKQMVKISDEVTEMKDRHINYKETAIGHKYQTLTHHMVLYAMILWTIFLWIMLPFSQKSFFWASQVVWDVPFMVEVVIAVVLLSRVMREGDVAVELGEVTGRFDRTLLCRDGVEDEQPVTLEDM